MSATCRSLVQRSPVDSGVSCVIGKTQESGGPDTFSAVGSEEKGKLCNT